MLLLVDTEEECVDVTKGLVGSEGVGALWVTVSMGVTVGVVAVVGVPLDVVPISWVVRDDVKVFVGVVDQVEKVSVEVRSVVVVSDPVVPADVEVVFVRVVVGIFVLKEDGRREVVDDCVVPEVGADGTTVDVGGRAVEELFEVVMLGKL